MSREGDRYMWLLVMFDLPVVKEEQRKRASHFRRFLLKDGYIMMQLSVYGRICNGFDMYEKHMQRLEDNLPPEGSVRAIQITDRQYGKMRFLISSQKEKRRPKHLGPRDQLLLF